MIIRDARRRRLARDTARAGAAFAVAMFGATVWVGADSGPSAAAAIVGEAEIVTPEGQPLTSGTDTTPFTVKLPAGASCTGDTANEGYLVHGYMVAAGIDPSTLTFNSDGPVPLTFGAPQASVRAPLYDVFGTPFANGTTANAVPSPGPGLITDIPTMHLAPLAAELLVPSGDYNVGVACWRAVTASNPTAVLDRIWNVELSLVAVEGDPSTATWSVAQDPVATTTALAALPAGTAVEGDAVTLTATVTPSGAAGTVTFRRGADAVGAPVPVTAGSAQLVTSALPVGSFDLTASFTPTDPDPFAASVSPGVAYTITAPEPAATTTALAADPVSQAPLGDPVTLTATVTPADAAGAVTFLDGVTPIGTPVAVTAGTATTTTSALSVGTRTLTASFAPAEPDDFAASTSPTLSYLITDDSGTADETTTALAVDPATEAPFGDEVTLTTTVTPADAVGAVTFLRDGVAIGAPVPVAAGSAELASSALALGSFTLTAHFVPTDPDAFTESISTGVAYEITLAETTTALAASPASSAAVGATVTLTATVTPADAAGTVSFFDGATAIGTPVTVASGTASTTTAALTVGTHALTATLTPGDGSGLAPSTSSAVSYEITTEAPEPTATSVSLAVSPSSGVEPGDDVTLTATVTPSTAAGTVTFKDGDDDLEDSGALTASWADATLAGGTATLTVTDLTAGAHTFTATFTPTDPAAFAASSSSARTLTVATQTSSTTSSTSTTTSSTSTTIGSTTSTTASGATTSTTARPGNTSLPRTGQPLSLAVWAGVALALGSAAILLGRRLEDAGRRTGL